MYLQKLRIQNFKSFQDVTVEFNADLNVFTGINNSGKTTLLEAISLWGECFKLLIRQTGKGDTKRGYQRGDWVLFGQHPRDWYFAFDEVNSVRSPHIEDIFHERGEKQSNIKIILTAWLADDFDTTIELPFLISYQAYQYNISFLPFVNKAYKFTDFNQFIRGLNMPHPFQVFYASPVAIIEPVEDFVTQPHIKDFSAKQRGFAVLRNRLYDLYNAVNQDAYLNFLSALSKVLYNTNQPILTFEFTTKRQEHTQVKINYIINHEIPKDISLLGSGTLQIIEILLNLYSVPDNVLGIFLLDEPDSHIHRDIQQRLLSVVRERSTTKNQNQVFISTHNDALIRGITDYRHIFHLEGKKEALVRSIVYDDLVGNSAGNKARFFTTELNPLMASLGYSSGLDIVNALEADLILIVEGEQDAKALHTLLRNREMFTKKVMFWIVGSIDAMYPKITAYKIVFSEFKNQKNLWEKSFLIFDKDLLMDTERKTVITEFQQNKNTKIPTYVWESYTFESVLLSDLDKLALALSIWQKGSLVPFYVISNLQNAYQNIKPALQARYTERIKNGEISKDYKKYLTDNAERAFQKPIAYNTHTLQTDYTQYVNDCLNLNEHHKLMDKHDTEFVIKEALMPWSIDFNLDNDFIDLLKGIKQRDFFAQWNFLLHL